MHKTLIATAVGVALAGSAWAGDISQTSGDGDGTLEATSTTDVSVTATDIGNDKSTGDNRGNDGSAAAEGYGTAAANNGSTSTNPDRSSPR